MIKRPTQRAQVTQTTSVPAPVGGLNAKDAIANMPPTDAVVMSNWFCTPGSLQVRGGSQTWATGMGSSVESLLPYNGLTGRKIFAVSNGAFWDVTNQGAVSAPPFSGQLTSRWQSTNFGTPGGQYLYAVAQDALSLPKLYNGTTWQEVSTSSTPIVITGVNPNVFCYCAPFKSRMYFIERNTLHVWYLPVTQVGGAAQLFDMSSLFRLGGHLVAMSSWSVDTASGPQDLFVFLSSEGEVIVYQGYDPSQSGSWGLQATFRIGRPIGNRPLLKVGADILIITADGVIPLSAVQLTDRASPNLAISDKIQDLISDDIFSYGSHFGWQLCLHPIGSKLIVNVPQVETGLMYQYVMNTQTKMWSRFDGWNANCFEILGDVLYYGGLTNVYVADIGNTDNGIAIITDLKPAFSYFGTPGQNKQFTMARPVFSKDGNVGITQVLNTDYRDSQPNSALNLPSQANVALWNVALWNVSYWSVEGQISVNWQTVFGVGYCASMRIKTISSTNASLLAIDYGYQVGGVL